MSSSMVRDVRDLQRGNAAAFRPWFVADWRDALFAHYSIEPAALQPHVPFELDRFDGRAFVSLVAFTQARLRPAIGGRLGAWAMRPVATHGFLNLRTYVRAAGGPAIYFLHEWIPNWLARVTGPALYALPFRLGKLDYAPGRRDVTSGRGALRMRLAGRVVGGASSAAVGSLDDFLLERYVAFAGRGARARRFEIRHAPWSFERVTVAVEDDSLIRRAAPWFGAAAGAGAHQSAGVFDVQIGGPRFV